MTRHKPKNECMLGLFLTWPVLTDLDGDTYDCGGEGPGEQTISATVNVATLDLSDPAAIHQHLSQLNDTVLRVKAFETVTPANDDTSCHDDASGLVSRSDYSESWF